MTGHQTVAELGHQLASKLTAQLILIDMLVDVTEGEAADLVLQLAEEVRALAPLAERLQGLGCAPSAAPTPLSD